MNAIKEFNQIRITARRWFNKRVGNTYHSVRVVVDGKLLAVNNYSYGYDQEYEKTGFHILQDAGYYPKTGKRLPSGLDSDFYDFSIDMINNHDKFISEASNVTRKKDLAFN